MVPDYRTLLDTHLELYRQYDTLAIGARADLRPEWEDYYQTAVRARKGAEAIV